MEQEVEYRQQLVEEYKQTILPLLRYLPWLEQHAGKSVSSVYGGQNIAEHSVTFPVYDGTVMNFVREIAKTSLMDKNYAYVYTRNHIKSHDDERRLIAKADWRDWHILCGILSKYVLGGMTKCNLWNEAVKENIFYLVLSQMKEIVEYWDRPIDKR